MIVMATAAVFCATLLFTGAFRGYAMRKGLIDVPGSRTSHAAPTPRGGGAVFVLVVLIGGGILYPLGLISDDLFILTAGSFLMATVGIADDYFKLPNSVRFVAQLLAAAAFLALVGAPETLFLPPFTVHLGLLGWPLAVLFIVWSVNLFNFMDGVDGIASMEAIVIFAVLAALGAAAGAPQFAALMLVLIGAISGFLKWNFPPAKIFMGDGGSYFLGFMIAGATLLADIRYHIPLMVSVILYGLFWFDATVTLFRRMSAGKNWYSAHKSHAYQRLHQAGRTHLAVTGYALLANLALAALAVAGYFYPAYLTALFAAALILLAVLYAAVERIKPFTP